MSKRTSIEKKRMVFVYDFIQDNNTQLSSRDKAKKFESYVQKVPAFILTNGLGNTLAYLSTQTDQQWIMVQKVIVQWLAAVDNPVKSRLPQQPSSLKDIITVLRADNLDHFEYRAITVEVLALFNWLRRLAKAHRLTFKSESNG